MARYTNYDDLLKKLHDLGLDEISRIHKVNAFNHFIKNLPTADVVEVKHGEWKKIECGTICTNCNRIYDNDFEFSYKQIKEYFKRCPECGAKMDGRRDT